jgi:hypothetical protein
MFARTGVEEAASAQAQAVAATEYDMKLTLIYLTSKFTTWPDESAQAVTPFVIGIVDPDAFQAGLRTLAKRTLKKQKRPIRVFVLKSEADYLPCHVLFIPREANPAIVNNILKRTANEPVLVWRDEPDPKGSVGVACTFIRKENEFLIEADPAEFKRRNLTPDGQLMSLKLVRTVKPN